MAKVSNTERTGIRDTLMSKIHRFFGDEIKMTDLDFIEVSRITYAPLALIECKCGLDTELSKWQRVTYSTIAKKCSIPAFCLRRDNDATEFSIEALNDRGKALLRNLFRKDRRPDYYYRLPDGTIRCSIQCVQALLQAIHGRSTVTQSALDIAELKRLQKACNPIVPEKVDLEDLLGGLK